jgi:endonuclease/exonuclease/phosphatase family metal-dependent hydrolase
MAGCLLGTRWAVLQSPLFGAAGAAGAYLLYYGDPLPAYGGGLVLAVFTAASWPATYAALYRCRAAKGRMMFVGQLAYVFLEFTTVWNIAYMFLDLGDAFREAPHYPLFFSVAVMAFSNMVAEPASARGGDAQAQARPRGVTIAGAFAALLGLALYVRHAHGVTRPHRVVTEPGRVKTMIWNVHTGYADTGYDNYELAAAFLQDMQAGVIAILENDQARPCTANRDQIEYLGASLGFPYHNYGIKTRDSTWGCAFISLYPIKDSNVTVLPSPYGTRSCLIDAVLDVDGHDVNVVVSHFSTEEFPEDLRLQTAALSARTRAKDTLPLVVMCYITSAPTAATWKKAEDRANYGTLVAGQPAGGTLRDPDPRDFDRWCQYIFYKNTVVDKYYHVDTGYVYI